MHDMLTRLVQYGKQLSKEPRMAKAKTKTEKLNFSKFFPDSTSYVSVSGSAIGSDDFSVNVKIGDGNESISIFASDWYKDDALATLKAIQEGVTKAIEFQQKALKLPKVDIPQGTLWGMPEVVAKKVAPKKKAAKK